MQTNRIIIYAFFGLAGLFAFLHIAFVGLTNDNIALLHYSLLLLSEGGLYSHWIQFNTPLAILLYVPPAAVSAWLHLAASSILYGYVSLLCLISLMVTRHAMVAHNAERDTQSLWLAAAAATLFITPCLCFVFGDREHLLFVFAMPWIIQILLGMRPLPFTTALASIGFFLKPYNLIIFIVLQLLGGRSSTPWKQQIFAPSSWIIALLGILYLAGVHIFFPAYIKNIVPLAYITYPFVYQTMAEKASIGAPVAAVGLSMIFFCMRSPHERKIWYGFLGAATLVYFLNAGWGYTLYLIFAPVSLLCFMLWQSSMNGETHRLPPSMIALLSLIMGFMIVVESTWSLAKDIVNTQNDGHAWGFIRLDPGLYDQLRMSAGDHFILLSTTLWGTSLDTLEKRSHSVFAYDSMWPLPWLMAHPDDEKSAYVRDWIVHPLVEALTQYPQATLIVDESPVQWKLPPNTDMLAFFSKDKDIQPLLSLYAPVETLDKCDENPGPDFKNAACRYSILRRKPATPQ